MAPRRTRIPGISQDAERNINQTTGDLEDRVRKLERKPGRAGRVISDTAAKAGEFLNVEAPPAGLTVIFPEPVPSLLNARITLSFRNTNPVRLVCIRGEVNRETFVVNTAIGTFEAICDGLDGWSVETGLTSTGSSVDAEYLVGAAHGSLPSARVATDSTEVDVDLTVANVASWALRTASVVFGKLQNLTGLSVLGRAANSAGVMAAITAAAGDHYLRSNTAGTALEFGNPASTSIINTAGTFQVAAFSGAISRAQNALTTQFSGIRDNGSLETARGFLNFLSTASDTVVSLTQDAGNDEIEFRVSTLGSFYALNGVGAIQTKFISFDSGSDTVAALVDNTGGSGYINVSYSVNKTSNFAWTGVHSFTVAAGIGNQFVVDVNGDIAMDAALIGMNANDIGITSGTDIALAATGEVQISADALRLSGDGFLIMEAATVSTPSLTANHGLYWVGDPGAPATVPMFTDDANVDHELAYVEDLEDVTHILEIRYNDAADASISEAVPAGCTWFEVECVGAGGGGGGADADDVKDAAAGSGGGAGGWFRHRIAVVSGTITGSIGAAGTAGSNTGGNGGTGGSTILTYNAVSYTAVGGFGGDGTTTALAPNGNSQFNASLGSPGGISEATATEQAPGGDGHPGMMFSVSANANSACGGNGGASYYGGGGRGGRTNADGGSSAGSPGRAPGSGGGGGARTSTGLASTGAVGGAGAPGAMKITFYRGTKPTEATIN